MGKTFTYSTEARKKEKKGEKGYSKFTLEQKMRFGDNLREMREAMDLTQKKVADDLKIAKSTYANYEQGVSMPTPLIQEKLAKYFHTTVISLVYGYSDDDATKFMEYTKGCTDKQRTFILEAVKKMAILFYEMNFE